MGPVSYPNDRLGLQICVDGTAAFDVGTRSLIPWVWANMSLPPTHRVQAKYMILYMLLYQCIKYESARKYYDFAVEYELNDLFYNGINGVRVKVFTASLDTKGKEEISGM